MITIFKTLWRNTMKWLRELFKAKPKEYFYYKKIKNKYYGLCGTERLYIKKERETGSCSQLWDGVAIAKMENKGWIFISKYEFSVNTQPYIN